MIVVTLRECLTRLEAEESAKPPGQRRHVPTIPELARRVGVSRATLYNLAGGYVEAVNLKTLSAVLSELRRDGFDVKLTDLLTVYPAELVTAEA